MSQMDLVGEDFRDRGPTERDREMNERIGELREKRHRGERLTYREWEILQMASQGCHCGQGKVQ